VTDGVISDVTETLPPEASSPDRISFLKLAFREERFVLVLSVFIGLFSGLAVVCFRVAIEWSSVLFLGATQQPGQIRLILAPVLVSFVVAILVIHVFPTVRGSGVNQTKAALYIYNGYIPFRTGVGKFITSALAIGAGHSLGPEDPSLQIGASIASALGRYLKLSREKLRLLAPVGAAAGLAAAFNAPISAVLFVIEEVIGRWSAGILGSVVLAAISSVVVVRWFLGSQPLFRIPAISIIRPQELLAYAALGVIGGFAAFIFAGAISRLRPHLKAMPRWTQYFQPSIAGLIVGLIGYLGAPQAMGAGYNFMDQAMHGQFTWKVLAMLAALKILSTTSSFVSGTPGGMFAPTLFIGAMLGGAVGGVERLFFPALTGSVGTYALVGMGVLFAAFLRVPMTSVFMVLEVSGNYSIIVPVIVANTIAYVISRSLLPTPIFDELTRQDGLELPSMEEQREESILRVEDAMQMSSDPVLDAQGPLAQAVQRAQHSPADVFLVRLHPTGWTTVSVEQLKKYVSEGKGEMTLAAALPRGHLPYLHPDLPLEAALRFVYEYPLVPVVSRADFRKLEGVISREAVLNKYKVVSREAGD
jgi:CIC family chloride channel protein